MGLPARRPGQRRDIFGSPVYQRGAMALHKLRQAVDDRRSSRSCVPGPPEHRNGHGTTAQFTALAERVSGKDLDPLFKTWIGTKGKPSAP